MTPEQQRIVLCTYGPDWLTAQLLLSDDGVRHARDRCRSGSVHDLDGYARERRGFKAPRATLPADLLARLRDAVHHRPSRPPRTLERPA